MKSIFSKFVYGFGYQVSSELVRIFKTKNLGVKIVIFSKDRDYVLLVEHSYKTGTMWYLPGGAIHIKERPDEAIIREIYEELGLKISVPNLLGIYKSERETDDLTFLFTTKLKKNVINKDILSEINDAAFFGISKLPSDLSPGVEKRIKEAIRFRKNKQSIIWWGVW